MATDTGDADVDPEELRADLDRIQEAMGIADRYERATEQWLVFGALVGLASLASQYVYSAGVTEWAYAAIWLVGFGGGATLYYGIRGSGSVSIPADKPNIALAIAVPYLGAFPLLAVVGQFADLSGRPANLATLAVIVIMIGVGYAAAANGLRAYRIRARDRYAFYVGALWMAALGVAMPAVEVLRTWPYLAFGGLYVAYALATYVVLER